VSNNSFFALFREIFLYSICCVTINDISAEPKLSVNAEHLAIACTRYSETIATVQDGIHSKIRAAAGRPTPELQKSIDGVNALVQADIIFLERIQADVGDIIKSKQNRNFLTNVLTSAVKGRAEMLKAHESQLVLKAQTLNALLTKDLWQVTLPVVLVPVLVSLWCSHSLYCVHALCGRVTHRLI